MRTEADGNGSVPRGRRSRFRAPVAFLAVFGASAASLTASGCFARQYRVGPRIAWAGGDPVVQMTPSERMPRADWVWMVPLARHSRTPDDDDRVLGLVVEGRPRAYPIGLLDRFEVVNDDAGGVPFVVVRCGLTNVAAAWDRRVPGGVLLFETTGALWRDTLVLRDRGTGSLWSAATGRAIAGPLAGARLRGLPTALVRTDRWDEAHPDGLFLDLGAPTSPPLLMRIYRASPMQGVSGQRTADLRHRAKEEVFVVEGKDSDALAFTAKEIERRECVEARLSGEPLTILWEPSLSAPRAFRGEVEAPVVPMFWFAVAEHFERVETLGPS
jgi:hypothetical protein